MMSLFHLFSFAVLFFNSSTASDSKTAKIVAPKKTVHSSKESGEYLPWTYTRPLTWEDFLCEPKHNTDAVALTSTALGISYNVSGNQLHYEIDLPVAYFAGSIISIFVRHGTICFGPSGHF